MAFDQFLKAHGLRARHIIPDGKWRRCATEGHPNKKNGSYKLAPSGTIGWCQDWATMDAPVQWTSEAGAGPVRPRTEMVADHRRMMADQQEAIRMAKQYYAKAVPIRDSHPYLDSHGLNMAGCYGLRIDARGWLIVPAFRNGEMVSYQRISPDGEKRFAKGAPIQGSLYTIDRQGASLTIICEGLATGLALYAAIRESRVVVCWHAHNLSAAQLPRGWRVIAADNDHATEARTGRNPGLIAAREAARSLRCDVAYPEGITGTDWCDYRRERLEARRANPPKFESETRSQQVVDAEIRQRIMARARFA